MRCVAGREVIRYATHKRGKNSQLEIPISVREIAPHFQFSVRNHVMSVTNINSRVIIIENYIRKCDYLCCFIFFSHGLAEPVHVSEYSLVYRDYSRDRDVVGGRIYYTRGQDKTENNSTASFANQERNSMNPSYMSRS